MSSADDIVKVQHLSWRAGFGADRSFQEKWEHKHLAKLIRRTIHGSEKKPDAITVPESDELTKFYGVKRKSLSVDERKELQKMNGQGIRKLNESWLNTMVSSEHPLREKMSLFWHGHFACRVDNVTHSQQLLQVIRDNALGNFSDLLFAVSKSPAMLQFLNNQQNRKQHANENFAREVMELFTMGRGNYTEDDVKAGARAFTGWGFDAQGNFQFRKNQHDEGQKTFLGKTGNFDGDDTLKIILEHPATAYHVTRKICKFFVNEDPDDAIVKPLAEKFYQSSYDIKSLMQHIFTAPWFYDNKNIGVQIKSPVELLVGMQRAIPVSFANGDIQLLFQRIMDQVLFYPPNVGGWPGGRDWIDSSTLMFRLRLPQIIYYSQEFSVRPKEMPDEMADSYMTKTMNDVFIRQYAKRVKASVDWTTYIRSFDGIADNDLPKAVADTLLVNVPNRVDSRVLNNYADNSSRDNYIKTLSIDLMSTPEYQLC